MLKFEVDSRKKQLRIAISAIISTTILSGCGALTQKPPAEATRSNLQVTDEQTNGFCYNGGRVNDYSCDPSKATAQADMRKVEINEEWMNSKLSEVHSWLVKEKEAILNGKSSSPTAAGEINNPAPQNYITTVSISTPTPQQTSPEIAKILTLSQQGQHQEALAGINKVIADNPNMAAAKLTKGIIFSNMGDKATAKTIFQDLMNAYPDRPEAFNNLAVIYAEEGNFPQAIETLQQAFQTHPSYAQVHSNLKELYATLASQAYNKALDLGSVSTVPELTMINRVPSDLSGNSSDQLLLLSNTTHSPLQLSKADIPEESKTSTEPTHIAPTIAERPPVIMKKEANPIEAVSLVDNDQATSKGATTSKEPITSDVQAELAEVVKTATKKQEVEVVDKNPQITPKELTLNIESASNTSKGQATPEALVAQNLQNWADAWSNKDYQGYVNAYTDLYRPNAKLSHNQWVEQRQLRITKPKFIRIDISNIRVKILRPNLAEARFEQRYQSDTYQDAVHKRVMMVNSDGKWKISLERSLGLIQ